jgi:Uma2 family endonuclease
MKTMPSVARLVEEAKPLVLLQTGDRMNQRTFHRLYLQTPDQFKAELIGGVVYVASPVTLRHGGPHQRLSVWIGNYSADTDGTDAFIDTTMIMADDSEPQPDLSMVVLPEAGGQLRVDDAGDYFVGAPELAIEISYITATLDLNAKRLDYERYGVREYLVVDVEPRQVHWFTRRGGRFAPLKPDAAGVLKSKAFPGLWLDPATVFDRSARRLLAILRKGLASPEHAKFVAKLAKKLS